jgi:hypothetical protein
LQRRHVGIGQIRYVGKESNSLEEVESGLVHSAENVYTGYPDQRRDEFETKVLPVLRKIPPEALVKMSGLSPTTIKDTLAGRSRPYPENRERLATIAKQFGFIKRLVPLH